MMRDVAAKNEASQKRVNTRGALMSVALMTVVFAVVWVGVFEPYLAWR